MADVHEVTETTARHKETKMSSLTLYRQKFSYATVRPGELGGNYYNSSILIQ